MSKRSGDRPGGAMKVIGALAVGSVLAGAAVFFVTGRQHGRDAGQHGPDTDGSTSATSLTMFEEDLLGGWSRYHSYDGSTQNLIFFADRTACEWETNASGSVTDEESFGYWELREVEPTVFEIARGEAAGDVWDTRYVYRFADGEILFGAVNLIGTSDGNLVECFS